MVCTGILSRNVCKGSSKCPESREAQRRSWEKGDREEGETCKRGKPGGAAWARKFLAVNKVCVKI